MPEEKLKISPGLIIVGGLGLGLVAAVGVFALAQAAPRVGFRLSIVNPPPGSTNWSAEFYSDEEGAFIYPPEALTLDKSWNCAYNPYGATDLRVRVYDFVNAITVHDQHYLGPVNSGGSYIYDCATGVLSEV